MRISDARWVKRILTGRVGGKRRRGRLRNRWLEKVSKDLRVVGVRNWKDEALDRVDLHAFSINLPYFFTPSFLYAFQVLQYFAANVRSILGFLYQIL